MPPPPRRHGGLYLGLTLMGALVCASFISLDLAWSALFSTDTPAQWWAFLCELFPPDLSAAFWLQITRAGFETLAMSLLGTTLAALCGAVLALPASGRFGRSARLGMRMALNFLRAIPELVWASILLIAAGLGPFAGTLALAAHTTGVLGRLFAETLENTPPEAESTLLAQGSGRLAAFLYGCLPSSLPQLLSYILYRWENNIRAAAVLGVVGAGGLGQALKFHLSLFHMPQAASLIVAMLLLVALVDALSFALRRHLAS